MFNKKEYSKSDYGVRTFQSQTEHSACVLVRADRQHDQPRDVRKKRLPTVGMLCRQLPPDAATHPNHDGDVQLAARHVQERGGVVDDLVEGQQAEIDGHHLHNRAHPGHRRADKAGLGQRHVHDSLGAKFPQKPFAHGKCATVATHVLAEQKGVFILLQSLADGLFQGFAVGDFDWFGHFFLKIF